MENKVAFNEVLSDLEPYIADNAVHGDLTLLDDVSFRKMIIGLNIPLFAGIYIHLKLLLHRFTAAWHGNEDPYSLFHAGKHYGAIASLYRDDAPYHMLWMFMDNLMSLDMVKIPLSDPVARAYVNNSQEDFSYSRKDHAYRQAFETNSYLLTRITNQMMLGDEHAMELNSTAARWINLFPGNTVPVYYSILINEREVLLKQAFLEQDIPEEAVNEKIDTDGKIISLKQKYEAACLMAFNTSDPGVPRLNFQYRDIGEVICGSDGYSQVDSVSEMKKLNSVRRELLRISHPDSLEFKNSSSQVQKLKSIMFRKISSLDPSDPDFRRVIEDTWINYSLAVSAFDSENTLEPAEKLRLLLESNRGLGASLSRLIEECSSLTSKIESLKSEILLKNTIYGKLSEAYNENSYKN